MVLNFNQKYKGRSDFLGGRGEVSLVLRKYAVKDRRINLLFFLIFILSFLIIFRLFNLQVLERKFYSGLASGQHEIYEQLFAKRGEIFMKDSRFKKEDYRSLELYPLATNKEFTLVYAVPKEIEDPKKAARYLSKILGIPEEELLAKLSKKDDPYEPLKHKISDEEFVAIKNLDLKGIEFSKEIFRYYPEKNIGSHLAGFVGYNDKGEQVGQYGLEGYFNSDLAGEQGYLKSEKDLTGRLIGFAERDLKKARNGSDLILTIDRMVETVACDKIKEAVERYGAEAGSVIIMDPKTGAIIAMCSFPDFNPNEYSKVENINVFNNPVVFTAYEPGSVFKPITMAAALEEELVNPETTYIDQGSVQIGSYTIKNSDGKAYGLRTMTQVLEQSLNTGAIFVVNKLGNDLFRKYVEKFGFGSLTGIELDTEVAGNISSLKKRGEIYSATGSFGQGITATPLQLVTAFATIANGGNLVRPYIIDEIVKGDGTRIKTEPQIIRRVISERISTLLSAMLVSVIDNGHGKRAAVPGFYVAGKTGTAQISKKDGLGYESNATIGSFIGFAPVEDPRFVMIVKIDRPKDVIWAESSAAPVFGEIAKFLLNYYQIPPHK
jgi:cell division protein FtsI/penicillin-binding protein 2